MEKKNRPLIIIAAETIVIVGLIIAVAVLGAKLSSDEEDDTALPVMGEVHVPEYTGRYVSANEVIKLNDYSLGEIWIPVYENIPKSTIDKRSIKTHKGIKSYVENGVTLSSMGIDVSVHQGEIDWERVAAAGVDFAMIRLGYRGYESGDIMLDKNFEQNIEGATAAGIDVGVYFFSQATNVDEALDEAEFTLSYLEGYDLQYPVVFDWEVIGESEARTDDISVEELTDCAAAFMGAVEDAGYRAMLYSNVRTALLKFDLSRLAEYPLWIAEYKYKPEFYYECEIWQYTSEGSIDGIDGDVDLNLCYYGANGSGE